MTSPASGELHRLKRGPSSYDTTISGFTRERLQRFSQDQSRCPITIVSHQSLAALVSVLLIETNGGMVVYCRFEINYSAGIPLQPFLGLIHQQRADSPPPPFGRNVERNDVSQVLLFTMGDNKPDHLSSNFGYQGERPGMAYECPQFLKGVGDSRRKTGTIHLMQQGEVGFAVKAKLYFFHHGNGSPADERRLPASEFLSPEGSER